VSDTGHMVANPCIQCRVTPETKARLQALAQHHHVTESVLLKRLVEVALLQSTGVTGVQIAQPVEPVSRDTRVYVRLRPESESNCARGQPNGLRHRSERPRAARLASCMCRSQGSREEADHGEYGELGHGRCRSESLIFGTRNPCSISPATVAADQGVDRSRGQTWSMYLLPFGVSQK